MIVQLFIISVLASVLSHFSVYLSADSRRRIKRHLPLAMPLDNAVADSGQLRCASFSIRFLHREESNPTLKVWIPFDSVRLAVWVWLGSKSRPVRFGSARVKRNG